jgi:hypothetical protein
MENGPQGYRLRPRDDRQHLIEKILIFDAIDDRAIESSKPCCRVMTLRCGYRPRCLSPLGLDPQGEKHLTFVRLRPRKSLGST